MKNIFLTLIVVIIYSFKAYSQQPLILNAVDKYNYIYLPNYLMVDSVKGILYPDFINRKIDPNKKALEIWWNSSCNDGSYNLIITPQQILFTSGHNNPNPNYLFWKIEIDSYQYLNIKKGLLENSSKEFEKIPGSIPDKYAFYDRRFTDKFKIPEEWTKQILRKHETYCDKQINQQLKRYFNILNSYIPFKSRMVKPLTKEQIKNIKPKYFSPFEKELKGWVNHIY